jgi:hypothetical protein
VKVRIMRAKRILAEIIEKSWYLQYEN